YYIMNVHELSKKSVEQTAKILIQAHRNTSGPKQIELLETLLSSCIPELDYIKVVASKECKNELFSFLYPRMNAEVIFCYGSYPETLGKLGKYDNVDIVLSLSLVGGLNPDWESGSMLISRKHIPFSLKTLILDQQNEYTTQNHLKEAINDIIATQ